MSDDNRKPMSYEQKLTSGAERMARRMGGQFVRDQRWDTVVRASALSDARTGK
jgi:hypothetical protein